MLRVHCGQIIGIEHRLRQTNCQDSHALIQHDQTTIAIICDGCSEGSHSEVGARLGAAYLAPTAARLLAEGVALAALPGQLHGAALRFLEDLTALMQPAHRAEFIRQHLLFTVVGAIVQADEAIVFYAGDGLIVLDDQTCLIDQGNQPSYLAYHLIPDALEVGFRLALGFEVLRPGAGWRQIAIGSDGFTPELLPLVWGLTHPRGLQRKLNFWGNEERRFRDDATLITLERLAETPA